MLGRIKRNKKKNIQHFLKRYFCSSFSHLVYLPDPPVDAVEGPAVGDVVHQQDTLRRYETTATSARSLVANQRQLTGRVTSPEPRGSTSGRWCRSVPGPRCPCGDTGECYPDSKAGKTSAMSSERQLPSSNNLGELTQQLLL